MYLCKKLSMEITPDGVVDETFWSLGLSTSPVLEYKIIIPPAKGTYKGQY
jgi:hypothetical protein